MSATIRLFHEDARLDRFDATVEEAMRNKDGTELRLVLDRTAFYPASGGQPHDTGSIDALAVTNVIEEEPWGRIVHVIPIAEGTPVPEPGSRIAGEIDRVRRFDHMQQHTGQHLLSRAFLQLHEARTESFHLGERDVTVDLMIPSLSTGDLDAIEDLLAGVIRENRSIAPRWVTAADVPAGIAIPEEGTRLGRVRLVDVDGFDVDPCCGTHCAQTAEVGAITILGTEKVGTRVRVSFLCGERARHEARSRFRWTGELARQLSTDVRELPAAYWRSMDESKRLSRERTALIERIAGFEAAGIEGEIFGACEFIVRNLGDRPTDEALALSQSLRSRPRSVVALGWKDGSGARLLALASADSGLDVREAVAEASKVLDGRGGGRKDSAQGGGPASGRLEEALQLLRLRLTPLS